MLPSRVKNPWILFISVQIIYTHALISSSPPPTHAFPAMPIGSSHITRIFTLCCACMIVCATVVAQCVFMYPFIHEKYYDACFMQWVSTRKISACLFSAMRIHPFLYLVYAQACHLHGRVL